MMTLLLLAAILFVLAYSLGHHVAPAPIQSFLTPLLILSILYILGFAAWALIKPPESALKLAGIVLIAVIALYAARRLWGRIGERRDP